MGSMTGQDKATLEKEWANAEARLKLNKEDKSKWAEMGYTVRPSVYYDKILLVWEILKGEPVIKDIFAVTALDASFQGGLWLKMQSKLTGYEIVVTNSPQRLCPDLGIFVWLPFFNEVRFVSTDWNNLGLSRHVRLSMCVKMAANPGDRLREGLHYASELHVFREQFPQYAKTRF